ncbi:2-hydroxyacid dehydrogenase [Salsuginibacillus kocurii]|uniref:2-hydroxyacid dehydrogenase n=1 Tax=Salsuginibacillus kocurii TaxID=427078 RepID=UPI00035CE645|nr:D-glycerate dehydrogenase [Salsuginibacillus kocurii]
MKPKVVVTRKLPTEIYDQLSKRCQVYMWEEEEKPIPRSELEAQIKDAAALFCMITETVDAELLDQAQNLKVIANMAVGYNNIDISTCEARGIRVTNTPGVLTDTTADLAFALLMATARRIPEGMDTIRRDEWNNWSPFFLTGQDISHATLGIIGMGRIGSALAKRAKGFEMEVVYNNRSRNYEAERISGAVFASFDELLEKSDYVCLLTPYTKETHHLIGKDELQKMKKTAILINVSRGGTVDEEALYAALKSNDIYAAGLDVFEGEPIASTHPLLTLSNVVATPHIGSASVNTRMEMARMTARHILQVLNGEDPDHLVV